MEDKDDASERSYFSLAEDDSDSEIEGETMTRSQEINKFIELNDEIRGLISQLSNIVTGILMPQYINHPFDKKVDNQIMEILEEIRNTNEYLDQIRLNFGAGQPTSNAFERTARREIPALESYASKLNSLLDRLGGEMKRG